MVCADVIVESVGVKPLVRHIWYSVYSLAPVWVTSSVCLRVRCCRSDVIVQLHWYDDIGLITTYRVAAALVIDLYRENAIAIESQASDPNGGNVCLFSAATCTSQCKWRTWQAGFARNERNLHCDVHTTAENKHTLPPFGSLDSFWIMRSQRSRRRDKGLFKRIYRYISVCITQLLFQLGHMHTTSSTVAPFRYLSAVQGKIARKASKTVVVLEWDVDGARGPCGLEKAGQSCCPRRGIVATIPRRYRLKPLSEWWNGAWSN